MPRKKKSAVKINAKRFKKGKNLITHKGSKSVFAKRVPTPISHAKDYIYAESIDASGDKAILERFKVLQENSAIILRSL